MRPQDNRSQQSSLSLCDQDCGIRQSMRKIPHSDCSSQKTLNSCPVRSTGEAPPGWRGVQKSIYLYVAYVCLSISMLVCLSISMFVCLSICMFVCVFLCCVCLSISMFVCLSISIFVCL